MVVYLPTLCFGWLYFDDYLIVQETEFYTSLANVIDAFTRTVWLQTSGMYMYYRPVSTGFYIVCAWLSNLVSGQVDPWTFHVLNIALMGSVTALTHALLRHLRVEFWPATLLTVLLIVHPASVFTVAWVSGQNELLLAIFMLLGFISFLRLLEEPLMKQRMRWASLYALCFLAGLLTKENALSLPILTGLFLLSHSTHRRDAKVWGVWFATSLAAVGIWVALLKHGASQSTIPAEDIVGSLTKGFLLQFTFLGKFVLPIEFGTLPTYQDTSALIVAAGFVAAATFAIFGLLRLRRQPVLLFGFIWFMGFLLPTFANMDPTSSDSYILRSDRAFLASIGLLISLSQVEFSRISKWSDQRLRWALVAIGGLLLIFNISHQYDFKDGLSFYSNAARTSPNLAFAHTHLGDMYLSIKDIPSGIRSYERALSIKATEYNANNNLGSAYERLGDGDKAMAAYDQELRYYPKNILSLYNKGAILLRRGRHAEAEPLLLQIIAINPKHKGAWGALEFIRSVRGDTAGAAEAKKNFDQSTNDMNRGI